MYVYLNKAYICNDDVIGAEFVLIESTKDIQFETVHEMNFREFFERIKESILDFDIRDGVLLTKHNVRQVRLPSVAVMPSEGKVRRDYVTSLYDLLSDLANDDCLYVSKDLNLENSYTGYVPSFRNITVSESTMTVTISLYDNDNDRWYKRHIIGVTEDGILQQHDFLFAVPESKKNAYLAYDVDMLDKVVINNSDYILFKYKCNLSICNSTGNFIFSEPLLVHYLHVAYAYKNIMNCLTACKKKFTVTEEIEEKKSEKITHFSRSNNSGVFFKLKESVLNRQECLDLVTLLEQLLDYSYQVNTPITTDTYEKIQKKSNLPEISITCMKVIVQILESGKKVELDILDNSNKLYRAYSLAYLSIQLFLYNIRVSCVYNPKLLAYKGLFTKYDIDGSVYDGIATIIVR